MIDFFQKYFTPVNNVIYQGILVSGIIVGHFRFNTLNNTSKQFLFLLWLTMLVEFLAFYCAIKFQNNAFVYNSFRVLKSILLSVIYYKETKIKAYWILLILLLLFAMVNGAFYEPFFSAQNHHLHLVMSLTFIVYFFLSLTIYFKGTYSHSILNFPVFWVGSGWVVFSIASIIAFGFSKLYASGDIWDKVSTYVKQYSNYLLYLSFIPAFLSPQKSLNDPAPGK